MKNRFFVFILLGLLSFGSFAEQDDYFIMAEDSLHKMALNIIGPDQDEGRLENNRTFFSFFKEVLDKQGSFAYPFDSLETVSLLTPPDKKFRMITWYVPLSGQRFQYFGFVQFPEKDDTPSELIVLNDQTSQINRPGRQELSADNWFGAYYYELIHNQYDGEDHYTFLGWKGDNPQTRKRVVEPFYFRKDQPVFGRKVFDVGNNEFYRIVFEYSARVAMGLSYETHHVTVGGPRKKMIVFDRLAPTHESLRGHYQFYKPETNIFDGLLFEEGKWIYLEDVDARAPETPTARPRTPPSGNR